jgi:uncharacterized protein (DUF1501 family)
MKKEYSRRNFLQMGAGTLASSALVANLAGMRTAYGAAPDVSGYKALVCLFMAGGNQGFNWVVPTSNAAYNVYRTSRSNLALAQNSLLPMNGVASDGNSYGFHPNCPELQGLFNAGHLAVVSNVGTLIRPTTVAQAQSGSVALPPQLFSHIDQQIEWMTGIPQALERIGWAGRVADFINTQTGITPNLAYNINVGGANYWQEGRNTIPYVLGTSGAPIYNETSNSSYRGGARRQASLDLLNQGQSSTSPLVKQYAQIRQSAVDKVSLVNTSLSASGDFTTVFPATASGDSNLSEQLHQVARVIKAQSRFGDSRQLFFVQIAGFDTHSNELNSQGPLLGFISRYLNAFWNSMVEIGMQNNVSVFTASDFGRTLNSNSDGSDHGWGSHALVLGGAVQGGRYFGTMPNLAIGGPDDFGGGRLVPTTSADQYAATLARWFGIPDADLASIFPNLPNFTVRNLGFMG